MRQFRIGNFGRQPLSDLEAAPFDEGIPVGRKEFVQHSSRLSLFRAPLCAVPYVRSRSPTVLPDHLIPAALWPSATYRRPQKERPWPLCLVFEAPRCTQPMAGRR